MRCSARIPALATLALLACGPQVDDADDGAGDSTTGASETGASATTTASASGSSSSSSSGSTTDVADTSSDGSTGPTGLACGDEICTASQICEWAKDSCGAPIDPPDQQRCGDPPESCGDVPVCACDGVVYDSACTAHAAGVDVDALGGCTPPDGLFPCGSRFCNSGTQWCLAHFVDISIVPNEYDCHPLPPECGGVPSCDCVTAADECVSSSCEVLDSGDVVRSC